MALSDADLERLPDLTIQVARFLIGEGFPQDLVEDCAGDVVVDLCQRRASFQMIGEAGLRGYLRLRVRGCVLNKLKKARGHTSLEDAVNQELSVMDSPMVSPWEAVAEAMRGMVPQCHAGGSDDALGCRFKQECQLLMMVYVDDVGIENLAELLGWSKSKIHRDKEECRRRLQTRLQSES